MEENKDKLTELAERLLEKEVIFKEDLEKIFGKRPFEKEEVEIPLAKKEADKNGQEVSNEEPAEELGKENN